MPKVELNDLIIHVSPLTETIYAGVPDKRGVGLWLHKKDVTSDVLGAIIEKVGDGFVLPVKVSDGCQYEITVKKMKRKK